MDSVKGKSDSVKASRPDHTVSMIPGPNNMPRVAVLGTGTFGSALVAKMKQCGIEVIWGSRSPKTNQVPVEKVISESVVVMAVPLMSWSSLTSSCFQHLEPGTIVIDCSNRQKWCKENEESQAEQLQKILPADVTVVKCFNTISAYELENTSFSAGKQVPIAGDSLEAKNHVAMILDKLGYHVSDRGQLIKAREIENIPLSLFLEWRKPLALSISIWMFLYLLTFGRYHFCDDNKLGWVDGEITQIFVKYINKTCDAHALTLLAICYLPGNFAAYIQLIRRTKYSQFPTWLDTWLKMRKQLGIFMLLSASIHGVFYMLLWGPKPSTMKIPIVDRVNSTWDWSKMMTVTGGSTDMDWLSSIYLGAGVIAYFTAVILGVTSLPSVASSLSWREFRMIQSRLGWFCLLLATTHCAANGWKKLLRFNDCIFLGSEQVALIMPIITIALKIPLMLPCVDYYLTKIRQGHVY